MSGVLSVALFTLVAGCAGESTPSATMTPEPTPEPTQAESSGFALPSLRSDAGDLAGLLPDSAGGLTITYQSASGEDVFGEDGMSGEALDFLERLGAEPADISTAFGFGFDADTESGISILAVRVEGASSDDLRAAFIDTIESEGDTVGSPTTIGGKSVQAYGGDETDEPGYLYVHGDVVFAVGGSPPELVEEVLAGLP
jgi:hypothetical protein